MIPEYYGVREASFVLFCTSKCSNKGVCLIRERFTGASLNSCEAAVVGEVGQELVRALERAYAISSPSTLAHWIRQ